LHPDTAICFEQVSKSYAIYDRPANRLKELLTFNRITRHRDFWALDKVDFEVRRGETFCIVGENGSGKSTLLQIVAGILQPSCGNVTVNGRVSALLELGAGFNPEFSGRDNVYLNASILGLTTKEIDARYRDIEEFAEIGDFIRQPVKTYSSGMVVRLAFAVAINVDPEILLVDEALAVGDIYFRHRCMRKVHELRARGITILFVSHAVSDVKSLGDRTLWLERGRMMDIGDTERVVGKYLASTIAKDTQYLQLKKKPEAAPQRPTTRPAEVIDTIPNIDHRFGDGRAEIMGIALLNEEGDRIHLAQPRSKLIVRISVRAREELAMPIVGFMMRNHLGVDFSGTNTAREEYELPAMAPGNILTVDFHLDIPELYPGSFSFSPALADGTLVAYQMCDWIDNAITCQMANSDGQVYGFLRMPCRVELNAKLWGEGDAPVKESRLA
jgi:ABC-type polysaccharide/polyol phosphate transport system ATPase subunit